MKIKKAKGFSKYRQIPVYILSIRPIAPLHWIQLKKSSGATLRSIFIPKQILFLPIWHVRPQKLENVAQQRTKWSWVNGKT